MQPIDPIVSFRGFRGGFRAADGAITEVLKGIDLQVRRSAITAVVGETGSGKTMLALSVVGLTPKSFVRTEGSIWFDSENLCTFDDRRYQRLRGRRIAMVFQDSRSALNPVFTIGTQLRDVCRLHHGVGRRAATATAEELLARVQVPEPRRRMAQYPHELSGGTAQRVQLALALACKPELLLLDEPTTGLDVTIQADILDLVVELTRDEGLATCLITHDLGVVAETCDDVVVMRHGEICETGPTADVMTGPTHPYSAQLLAAARYETSPV